MAAPVPFSFLSTAADWPETIAEPLGHVNRYQYDAAGRLTAVTNPAGDTATMAYDALGRPVELEGGAGGATRFAYDVAGRAGGPARVRRALEAGLAREVYERTGLSVRIGPILHAGGGMKQDGTHLVRLLYLCGYESGEVRLRPEHQDYRWVSA